MASKNTCSFNRKVQRIFKHRLFMLKKFSKPDIHIKNFKLGIYLVIYFLISTYLKILYGY